MAKPHPSRDSTVIESANSVGSTSSATYRLMVQQVNSSCFFQLNWGTSQQLTAALPYPTPLTSAYQLWRHTYLSLYRQPDFGVALASPSHITNAPSSHSDSSESSLRGRAASSGQLKPTTVDRQASLAKAEATMLHQFQRWLRSSELYEIRAEIARAALETGMRANGASATVDISLTCTPLELERLPWEAWEIGDELAPSSNIRIARYPLNVRGEPTPILRKRASRMRVLAIMGDETGLDFAADRRAVERLAPIADIHFVGYQPGIQAADLKAQIVAAIDDDRGWDILFFAGHSTEAAVGDVTGGGPVHRSRDHHVHSRHRAPAQAS